MMQRQNAERKESNKKNMFTLAGKVTNKLSGRIFPKMAERSEAKIGDYVTSTLGKVPE
jgi:hypothetical protein